MTSKRDVKGKAKVGSSQATEEKEYKSIFRNPYSRERFALFFQNRPIVLERAVKLQELYDLGWVAEFDRRGWTEYMKRSWKAIVPIVREFYSQGDTDREIDQGLVTFVRGKNLAFDESDFGQVMGIQTYVGSVYPYSEGERPSLDTVAKELLEDNSVTWGRVASLKQKDLSLRYRILNIIVCFNIIPKAQKMIIKADQARMLYAIGTGMKINLPRLVMCEVLRNIKLESKKSLPFAGIITQLCRVRGVEMDNMEETNAMASIGRSTVGKSMKNVLWTQMREDLDDQMEIEEEEPSEAIPPRDVRTEDVLGAILQELQEMREAGRAREIHEAETRRVRKTQEEEYRRAMLRELEEIREISRAREEKMEEFQRDIRRQMEELSGEVSGVRLDVSGIRDRQEDGQQDLLDDGEDLRRRIDVLCRRVGGVPLPPPPPPPPSL